MPGALYMLIKIRHLKTVTVVISFFKFDEFLIMSFEKEFSNIIVVKDIVLIDVNTFSGVSIK